MEYKFEPVVIWSKKINRWFYFYFNISTHDECNSSVGLYIFIQLYVLRGFSICIKPFGEFKTKQ